MEINRRVEIGVGALLCLAAWGPWSDATAYTNFIGNPYALYPPGCVTVPSLQQAVFGDNIVKVASARIMLESADDHELRPADVDVFRVACADPGRSAIWLSFVPADDECRNHVAPTVGVSVDGIWRGVLRLAREPGIWGVGDAQNNPGQVFGGVYYALGCEVGWVFLLDAESPLEIYGSGTGHDFTAAEYNGAFDLTIRWREYEGLELHILATEAVLEPNPGLPLNGRLGGNWVADDAPDQGFSIAVSELVGESAPLRVENWEAA